MDKLIDMLQWVGIHIDEGERGEERGERRGVESDK